MAYKSLSRKVKAFDEAVFEKYQKAKVSVLSDVKPDISCLIKLKKQFLDGDVNDFSLTYNKNKLINYQDSECILNDLLLEVASDYSLPKIIAEQYILAISEKLTKIKMLKQIQIVAQGEDVFVAMKQFQECSDTLYGVIDSKIFCKTMQTIERDVTRKILKFKADNQKIEPAKRLLSIIDIYKKTQPNFHSLEVVPRLTKEKEIAITDADELKRLFEIGLQEYAINNDWMVVIDKRGARSSVSVSYNLNKIYLPSSAQLEKRAKRKRLTQSRINGLIAHEIGTHVLRKENGEKSVLKLLSVGLSGYEQGEEGLATYREQQAQSLSGYAGLEAYLAIGLAKGFDNSIPRNFIEVHKVLTDYYQVMESTTVHHAKELAWNRCLRTFRGTTGTIPGVVFSKDLMYRHGNIRHWESLESGKLLGIDLDFGKFDPTNNNHVYFLKKLATLR